MSADPKVPQRPEELDQIKIPDICMPDADWLLVEDASVFGQPAVHLFADGDICTSRVLGRDGVVRLHGWLGRWLKRNR